MATEREQGFFEGAQWALAQIATLPGVSLSLQHQAALSDDVIQAAAAPAEEPVEAASEPQTLAEAMGIAEPVSEETPAAVVEVAETAEPTDSPVESVEAPVTEAEGEAASPVDAEEAEAATA